MTEVRVTSVSRQPGMHSSDAITHLSGPSWRWTREQVIDSIRSGTNTFFMIDHGVREEIGVLTDASGPHLRTRANGHWTDDLGALPDCRLHEGRADE